MKMFLTWTLDEALYLISTHQEVQIRCWYSGYWCCILQVVTTITCYRISFPSCPLLLCLLSTCVGDSWQLGWCKQLWTSMLGVGKLLLNLLLELLNLLLQLLLLLQDLLYSLLQLLLLIVRSWLLSKDGLLKLLQKNQNSNQNLNIWYMSNHFLTPRDLFG